MMRMPKFMRGETPGRSAAVRRLMMLVILLPLFAAGCDTAYPIIIGTRPNPELLEKSLHVGESTRQDVLTAMGQPYATGKWVLPMEDKPRTLWCYYYEEGTVKDARRLLVFIYFDQDRYDGYMWFSSLPK